MKAYGLIIAVLKHDAHMARRLLPTFAGTIDVPTAAHKEMRNEGGTTGEMNQQPFASRLHQVDGLASERRVVIEARKQGIRGTKAHDRFINECAAHGSCCAEEGIAFWHSTILSG